jgi:hypothetical protein
MVERKEGTSGYKKRKITLRSFRRFVKTVIRNQANQDYSEWFLGHSNDLLVMSVRQTAYK